MAVTRPITKVENSTHYNTSRSTYPSAFVKLWPNIRIHCNHLFHPIFSPPHSQSLKSLKFSRRSTFQTASRLRNSHPSEFRIDLRLPQPLLLITPQASIPNWSIATVRMPFLLHMVLGFQSSLAVNENHLAVVMSLLSWSFEFRLPPDSNLWVRRNARG